MKLLACTDLHLSSIAYKRLQKKVKKDKPDLIVFCGDASIFEHGLEDMLKKLNKLKKKVIMIHGNHEDATVTKNICKKLDNLIFIHKKYHIEEKVLFLGYGGGGFAMIDKDLYAPSEKFAKLIKKHKDKKVVLITHGPPYKTKLDLIVTNHCGNKTLASFIKKNRIDLALCGHLHENFGKTDVLKKTKLQNPGPYGKIIRI